MSRQAEDGRLVTTSTRLLPRERQELERLAAQEERSVSHITRSFCAYQLSRKGQVTEKK